jgi:hypothetical protein
MAENYVLLERTELNDTAASVTFANIPQSGYTDLKVVMSVRDTYAAVSAALFVGFNGGTASLSSKYIQGSGSSAVSGNLTSLALAGLNTGANATASTFSNIELYIPNYTSSNYKSYSADSVTENNATEAYTNLIAGLWSNTAAITSMTFTCGTAFTANSTFSLYGIAALGTTPAIAPKAYGGNRIDNDGTYWYHTFTSSGTFTPQTGISCDVLAVAGGGGGGNGNGGGGGGGAGGFRVLTSQSLTSSSYAVTIGAGGAGGVNDGSTHKGSNGNDSTVIGTGLSLTSTAGGAGGSYNDLASNGGSGGGSGYSNTSTSYTAGTGNTPSTSPSQGNNGGIGANASGGTPAPAYGGGGGGGASANGTDGTPTVGGTGGAGSNAYSSWATVTSTGVSGYYAGGGGGGTNNTGSSGRAGGAGGGGTGGAGVAGSSATANTGSGGGGGGSAYAAGAAGGSGIVIVRYPIA